MWELRKCDFSLILQGSSNGAECIEEDTSIDSSINLVEKGNYFLHNVLRYFLLSRNVFFCLFLQCCNGEKELGDRYVNIA